MTQQDATFSAMPMPAAGTRPGWWTRVTAFDQRLTVAKGLTIVTLLTGFFGGYFQYLSAYEDKVSAQAKADMEAATKTFVDISNAFAEAQMLQELTFYNFADSLGRDIDVGDKQMITQAGNDMFPKYVDARTSLRQNASVFAHEAEIYIDWASDLSRDPGVQPLLGQDPLTEAKLGVYDFDCDAAANMPQLAPTALTTTPGSPASCSAGAQPAVPSQTVTLCAMDGSGRIDSRRAPITIDWQSAKHHVLTMHYCFEQAHRQILTARIWASKNPVSDERLTSFHDKQDRYQASLDNQVVRLNAFMSLTTAHLEGIRVKYRPSGFVCHVPLLRDAIGLFSSKCTPLGIKP
jgi:hypothetical protein